MKQAVFSVIIPTRANPAPLYLCLRAVQATITPETEVLVVTDNLDAETGPDPATVGLVLGLASNGHGEQLSLVQVPEGQCGFAAAANAGLAKATGKYLVILHDDTYPTAGWLDGLRAALLAAQSAIPETRWGYVGPMTNFAMVQQALGAEMPESMDPSRCEAVAAALRSRSIEEFFPSGPLDSCCLMMTRQAYTRVGEFDLVFGRGGHEDVDLHVRGQHAGFMAIRAPRVFVYHAGRTTLKSGFLGPHGDLPNQQVLMEKYYQPEAGIPTICFLLRLRLNTEAHVALFRQQLRQLASLGEGCVIVDDRSLFSPIEHAKELGLRDFILSYRKNPEHLAPNAKRDRNLLAQMGRESRLDWLMGLEQGFLFDPKVTSPILHELITPVDPTIRCFSYPIRTYWKDRHTLRVDEDWGRRRGVSLYRNLDWGPILAVQHLPEDTLPFSVPQEQISQTSKIIIEDFTYLDLDAARADGHVVRELPHLCIPASSPPLTYLLLVKNEMSEMPRQACQFKHWADDMVIVDNGSTDGVKEFCERFGIRYAQFLCCDHALEPNHMVCDFGAARNFAVDQCKPGYILFLDADEELAVPSYGAISHYLLEGADGYLCDINNHQQNPVTGDMQVYVTLQARLFKKHELLRYEPEVHETLEHAFKRHRDQLTLVKSEVTIEHHGYVREKKEERDWKGENYARKLAACIERDPRDARSIYALGQHLNSIRQFDRGDPLLGKALSVDPDFWTARCELGLRLMRRAWEVFAATPPRSVPTDDKRQLIRNILRSLEPWVRNMQ